MDDSKNDNFHNALRLNKTLAIECDKILYTDDISITFEIRTAQKVLRLIRFEDCIRQNQLNDLNRWYVSRSRYSHDNFLT